MKTKKTSKRLKKKLEYVNCSGDDYEWCELPQMLHLCFCVRQKDIEYR